MTQNIFDQIESKYDIPPPLELDGKYHHVKTPKGKLWYKGQTVPNGMTVTVGDFKTGEKETFKSFTTDDITPEMIEKYKDKQLSDKKILEEIHKNAAKNSLELLERGVVGGLTEYMKRKGWPEELGLANGMKRDAEQPETLLVPMRNVKGQVVGVQKIFFSGEKGFLEGTKKAGAFFQFGDEPTTELYICEGVATGMSVFLATQAPVFCAFDTSNLLPVAEALFKKYPGVKINFAADNDHHLVEQGLKNVGVEKAREAALAINAQVYIPECQGTDFNDLMMEKGLKEVGIQLTETTTKTTKALEIRNFKEMEDQGFYKVILTNGGPKKLPDIDGLISFFDHNYKYKTTKDNGTVWSFKKTHYEEVSATEVKMFAEQFFFPRPPVKTIQEFAFHIACTNPVAAKWFNESTEGKVNFKNGVLDLRSGEFVAGGQPELGFRSVLQYDYDSAAKCPKFDQMMETLLSGDKERIQIILEFMGYALSGMKYSTDKLLMLTSDGGSGKSRLLNVMRAVFGEASVSLNKRALSSEFLVKRLDGAKLGVCEEMPSFQDKEFWEEMKNLVSGGVVVANVKFKDGYEFENRCRLVITCNKLPHGTDPSHGYFRRFLIVPFDKKFEDDAVVDIEREIVRDELPGVFNRVWDAYKAFEKRGFKFSYSRVAEEQLNQYRKDMDSVAQWADEHEFVDTDIEESWLESSEMYKTYADMCKANGSMAVGLIEFFRRLFSIDKTLHSKQVRRTKDGKKLRFYKVTWSNESF